MYICCVRSFFFQAEDGIRDLVRSRGLGDVYKRQVPSYPTTVNKGPDMYGWNYVGQPAAGLLHWFPDLTAGTVTGQGPVSYTHLTLPTSDLV